MTTAIEAPQGNVRLIGILFLVAMAGGIAGTFLIAPIIHEPNYLKAISTHPNTLLSGVFAELLSNAAVATIGILLFPILKSYHEKIAVGYLGSRLVDALLLTTGAISYLLLPLISQTAEQTSAPGMAYYEALGHLTIRYHYLAFETSFISTGLGGSYLCYLLYRFKLVPSWLAIAGLIAYPILLIDSLLKLAGYNAGMLLFIPVAFFELTFPVWLIIKKHFNN